MNNGKIYLSDVIVYYTDGKNNVQKNKTKTITTTWIEINDLPITVTVPVSFKYRKDLRGIATTPVTRRHACSFTNPLPIKTGMP